jgi:hypothetical protein
MSLNGSPDRGTTDLVVSSGQLRIMKSQVRRHFRARGLFSISCGPFARLRAGSPSLHRRDLRKVLLARIFVVDDRATIGMI